MPCSPPPYRRNPATDTNLKASCPPWVAGFQVAGAMLGNPGRIQRLGIVTARWVRRLFETSDRTVALARVPPCN